MSVAMQRLLRTPRLPFGQLRPSVAIVPSCRTHYTWNVPKDTKRVKLDDGSTLIYRRNPVPQPTSEDELPPLLWEQPELQKLTQEQIFEARALRKEDPDRWTVSELAKKFNTYEGIIKSLVRAPPERAAWVEKKEQMHFDELPWRKKARLVNRQRRKALWW
ncbi:hypothetical protein HK104_004099 [Borealophlyctis nickersoniae]|nr:hypothetical protein HK104_004099 [Borealophlyctis nickersoniae]